ncbi:cell envelope integrity protein TolA [Apilactobacillus micheneri]|uniref:cell envelope integrity protein TolA n=1 Tax=Apilactobacillus micheneri TaxID=1899430 RepID=UPI0015E8700D|nr:cell envelope integrity protein TolA [Apilactobacillus micheneri]TPR40443.1 hypothetical protein DY119_01765 [Apilactobacillus micheneri]
MSLLLFVVCFIFCITYLVKYLSYKDKRRLYKGPLIFFSIATAILFVYGAFTSDLNPNSEASKDEKQEQKLDEQQKEKEAKINHQKEIKAKQKAKQEAEDKKEKQQTADLKKKNEQKNLQSYKEELTKIPGKTHNLISKAYIDDSGSEQTTIVLSDEAMNVSDSELKNVAHSAYNAVQSIIDNYKPFPEDSFADKIRITDSSGDLIAKSSMFDEFKFVDK